MMKLSAIRIPCISIAESARFYADKLQLIKVFGSESEGVVGFKLGDIDVLLEPQEKGEFEAERYLGFSVEVENIDDFYQQKLALGVRFTGVPEVQSWGAKMTHIIDPSGNSFSVIECYD
ncbi:VOC family protein [Pseudoalteromonas luteoviolacea]|uniref:VOC family protein n=1 Tax=Pseudoalteromonas luteoviolacea TaxID=43657 RepID=UPI001C8DE054|nr:VOC family protein [Pseudoalteromonas luteoviolacea]